MGVSSFINVSRPMVTSDAAAVALKAGSACVLRCVRDAWASCHAIVEALLAGEALPGGEGVDDPSCLAMTTESLTREYPLYTPSLLNLVKTSETRARELTGEDRT